MNIIACDTHNFSLNVMFKPTILKLFIIVSWVGTGNKSFD